MRAFFVFGFFLLFLFLSGPVFAETAEVFIEEGKEQYDLEEYDEAFKSFDSAVKLEPRNAKATYHRAKALYKLEKYPEALEGFSRAISLKNETITKRITEEGKPIINLGVILKLSRITQKLLS